MTDIEKELKKLGVTYDGYSVLQNKDGITVARISDGKKSYILKHKRVELSRPKSFIFRILGRFSPCNTKVLLRRRNTRLCEN